MAKKIPCPKLSKPVKPHIRSIPKATIARDKNLPSKFKRNTGRTDGAAKMAAKKKAKRQKGGEKENRTRKERACNISSKRER